MFHHLPFLLHAWSLSEPVQMGMQEQNVIMNVT